MKRQIVGAACGLGVMCATIATAETQQGVLVELYTSQGCSSCPPADEVLAKLVDQPGVIALSLHVDYWDYIGWKDTFGQAKFSDRQRAYAHAAGEKMIYTPQIIVAGGARVEGNQPGHVKRAVDAARGLAPVVLNLHRNGGKIDIAATSNAALRGDAIVQLVTYTNRADVTIRSGENAGKTISYFNIVTSWQNIGKWSGTAPLSLSVDAPAGPFVVVIQTAGPREVLAAAELK